MATVDMTHRKLNFPPRFLPYLEKHRIFELFYECIELLVQVKPKDHIHFLKTTLPCAAKKKDRPRIVFFSPPNFNRELFAEMVAECLGIQAISRLYMEIITRDHKNQDVPKAWTDESVQEESCICLGEEEAKDIYPPIFFSAPESEYSLEIIEEEEKKEEYPCVCPCVKLPEKEDSGDKEEEQKDTGLTICELKGDEWCGEAALEPCKKVEKKQPCSTTCLTVPDIDYGLLGSCEVACKGWILTETAEEAAQLCESGVLPTHALRIIVNEENENKNRYYKWQANDWMKVYKFVPVKEIRMGGRTVQQLANDMCKILSIMPHRHAPMLPRVLLMGSRGSGVTTQAEKLVQKYGMIHVDFEIVIARALQQDDSLAKLYKQQQATRVEPEVEAVILEKALLSAKCRKRGWVLTGYPTNIDQMRMLDIIATPPNRIIFLEVPARECFVRLFYRKFDPCQGDEYKIPEIEPCGVESYTTPNIDPETADRLLSHPKNNKKQIIHDIETYFTEKKEMMDYCKKTAAYIDGNKTINAVFEQIEQVIINPAPAQPPRDPLVINYGIDESYERLKKFRLTSGMFFNNLTLNPPEPVVAP